VPSRDTSVAEPPGGQANSRLWVTFSPRSDYNTPDSMAFHFLKREPETIEEMLHAIETISVRNWAQFRFLNAGNESSDL
jgi:hypothetical protein